MLKEKYSNVENFWLFSDQVWKCSFIQNIILIHLINCLKTFENNKFCLYCHHRWQMHAAINHFTFTPPWAWSWAIVLCLVCQAIISSTSSFNCVSMAWLNLLMSGSVRSTFYRSVMAMVWNTMVLTIKRGMGPSLNLVSAPILRLPIHWGMASPSHKEASSHPCTPP